MSDEVESNRSLIDILRCRFQENRIVGKVSYSEIASRTKKTTNFTGVVAVINMKNTMSFIVYDFWWRLFADSTLAILQFKHSVKFG